MNPGQKAGVFYWRKIVKREKDKQPQCGAEITMRFCVNETELSLLVNEKKRLE